MRNTVIAALYVPLLLGSFALARKLLEVFGFEATLGVYFALCAAIIVAGAVAMDCRESERGRKARREGGKS